MRSSRAGVVARAASLMALLAGLDAAAAAAVSHQTVPAILSLLAAVAGEAAYRLARRRSPWFLPTLVSSLALYAAAAAAWR